MSRTKRSIDYIFLTLTLVLLGIGLLVLWSASTPESQQNFGTSTYYVWHQLLYGGGIGLLAMYIVSRIDYHVWEKFIPLGVILSIVSLVAVKIPGIGFTAGGASRWIHLGPLFFQPAEITRLVLIVYLASWMSKRGREPGFQNSVLPALMLTGLVSLLIMWQPDLGSTLSIVGVAMVMFFIGGIRWSYFASITGAGIVLVLGLIKFEPYRMQRITAFLDRSFDPQGIAYQINQAILAIGTGGWWGYGYGRSRQKFFYLPEAINDSIFAIMAEELGLIRVTAIIGLFVALILRGIKIGLGAPDQFGRMLVLGLVGSIAINTIINIAAIIGLLPLTGIPLPLFSYGSSALLVTLAGLGIVLNVSRFSRT